MNCNELDLNSKETDSLFLVYYSFVHQKGNSSLFNSILLVSVATAWHEGWLRLSPLSRLQGVARFYQSKKRHVITTQTEHKCVLDSCRVLESEGFSVTYLPVQKNGLVDLEVYVLDLREDHTGESVIKMCIYFSLDSYWRPPYVLTPLYCRWWLSIMRLECSSPLERLVTTASPSCFLLAPLRRNHILDLEIWPS